jgi:hypothetical protein
MALETYYTFSADTLKAEIASGKYSGLRHFMFGSMGNVSQEQRTPTLHAGTVAILFCSDPDRLCRQHFEALAPQWVTAQNSLSAGPEYKWHNVTASAAEPSLNTATSQHSAWAQFSATCMYFGAELINAR